MFRTVGDPQALWEAVLPPELLVLPAELARVDALLDDPAFFAPFVPFLIRGWVGLWVPNWSSTAVTCGTARRGPSGMTSSAPTRRISSNRHRIIAR